MLVGNIVFMNFIIAVVSESYENCMETMIQQIQINKLDMIEECEAMLPDWIVDKYFDTIYPKWLIMRREKGSSNYDIGEDQF